MFEPDTLRRPMISANELSGARRRRQVAVEAKKRAAVVARS
jgi:hypothetical protein